MRKLGNEYQTIEAFLNDDGGTLPDDHPHNRLYWKVAPIWCDPAKDFYAEVVGETFDCGFAYGYESGLITAILKPEWALGWYQALREYYLAHNHTPEDLGDWQRHAQATTRAIPIHRLSPNSSPDLLQGFVPSAAPLGVEETM